MVKCDICGKGVQYGHNIRHTHTGQWEKRASKTRKIFLPNLQKGKVSINGVVKSVRACASCLAKFKIKYAPKAISPAV
jgi:large subunit ribosomal protein L28